MGKRVCFKFCGGCNPFYDRRALKERIISDLEACHFEFEVAADFPCDVLVVLNGCDRCCLDKFQFVRQEFKKIYVVKDEKFFVDEEFFA